MKPFMVVLALLTLASAAHAQSTTNEVFNMRQPLSGFTVNPCSGEPIVYSGECHLVSHIKSDGDGGTLDTHTNCHATGEGALGNSYVFNLTSLLRSETALACGTSQRFRETSRFITTRSTQNFFMTVNFVVTLDESCQVHVVTDETETDCRGRGGVF